MKNIVVIGSINMDMVVKTERLPKLGETILGGSLVTIPGGKGANQAVAAAKLGGSVALIGCVGEDAFGSELKQNLLTNNVDISGVKVIDGVSSGTAVITVASGDNAIIVSPGANGYVSRGMINDLEDMIKHSSMVVLQLEIPLPTVYYAIELAKKHGVKVLLNPAPAAVIDEKYFSLIDIFTPNESECQSISGIAIDTVEDAKDAARYFIKMGINQVVITLGKDGAVYNYGDEILHQIVPKVTAIDTTAAGDSFTGALAVAVTNGIDIKDAVRFASEVGSITVTRFGAQSSLPSIDEVKYLI